MTRRSLGVVGLFGCLLLGACNDDEPDAIATPTPAAAASAAASAKCLPDDGPPAGSARRPYLKRAMALECREDVKRLQQALDLTADGFFDADTAAAVIAKTKAYPCITANDGQVGPQTWSLIVDGKEPCKPRTGTPTAAATPAFARCTSGTAAWALRTAEGTVLRRCGDSLVLGRAGQTSTGSAQELGSSVCADFDTGVTVCVSDPVTDDTVEASTTGEDETVWSEDIEDRYIRSNP
ncbi:peptidoglycan-binding domain-containing protein [Sporichthya sp.]|uniref:peptidoglycan-binding domain-containing protein n=1 Tax=Sporichthya sp. TaxID=65475 RepID=UPI00179E57C4|nr:peptidoglycan-binding domain-containing protein [Sporichthya sp.]MBA3742268.1 peptidoglycan-binding protein [Sporichthya sp.]